MEPVRATWEHGRGGAKKMPAVRGAGLVHGPRQAARVVLEQVPKHRRSDPSRGPRGGRPDPDDRRTQGAQASSGAYFDQGGTG